MSNARDIDLLYEMGTLRCIDRVWAQFHGPHVANVAEHSLRVMWISLVMAKREGADTGRVLQLALIHDAGKSRAGDAHWLNRAYLKRDEAKAIADATAGTVMADDAKALWQEFKDGKTLEARIVKDADNLDVDLEFRERDEDWYFGKSMGKLRQEVFEKKLQTESAKALWQEIQTSDAHRWYTRVYHTPEQLGEVGAAEG